MALQIGAVLGAGLLMTFLGVDTSRLFGWTFMAFLVAWKELAKLGQYRFKRMIDITLLINLLVPTVYVQLNFEPSIRPGLYQTIAELLSGLIAR